MCVKFIIAIFFLICFVSDGYCKQKNIEPKYEDAKIELHYSMKDKGLEQAYLARCKYEENKKRTLKKGNETDRYPIRSGGIQRLGTSLSISKNSDSFILYYPHANFKRDEKYDLYYAGSFQSDSYRSSLPIDVYVTEIKDIQKYKDAVLKKENEIKAKEKKEKEKREKREKEIKQREEKAKEEREKIEEERKKRAEEREPIVKKERELRILQLELELKKAKEALEEKSKEKSDKEMQVGKYENRQIKRELLEENAESNKNFVD